MNITLNGQPQPLDNITTIKQLLDQFDYSEKLVAVAVNGNFLPKSDYDSTRIKDSDKIEIVAPMQGG